MEPSPAHREERGVLLCLHNRLDRFLFSPHSHNYQMDEENTWVDFSDASPWEASVTSLEEVFDSFHIGVQLLGSIAAA